MYSQQIYKQKYVNFQLMNQSLESCFSKIVLNGHSRHSIFFGKFADVLVKGQVIRNNRLLFLIRQTRQPPLQDFLYFFLLQPQLFPFFFQSHSFKLQLYPLLLAFCFGQSYPYHHCCAKPRKIGWWDGLKLPQDTAKGVSLFMNDHVSVTFFLFDYFWVIILACVEFKRETRLLDLFLFALSTVVLSKIFHDHQKQLQDEPRWISWIQVYQFMKIVSKDNVISYLIVSVFGQNLPISFWCPMKDRAFYSQCGLTPASLGPSMCSQ